MSSIYIHFPYCLYKCVYCDFNSYATPKNEIPHQKYAEALIQEIRWRAGEYEKSGLHFLKTGTKVKSIFLGGGTPSLMNPSDLEKIFAELTKYFSWDKNCEVTLETNPGTVDKNKLKSFLQAGVNRISLGVQSLDERFLSSFGRIHTAADAKKILKILSELDLKSWNADLISGFPGMDTSSWEKTLREALSFSMPHLSCYSFMVEEGAPYFEMLKRKKAEAPDSDEQARQLEVTQKILSHEKYTAYEISNFAKPGHECVHNLTYWNYESFLGLGAGAVSFLVDSVRRGAYCHTPLQGSGMQVQDKKTKSVGANGNSPFGRRTQNYKLPSKYMKSIYENKNFFDEEIIDELTARKEFLMMSLRLKKGCSEKKYEDYFNRSLEKDYQILLKKLRDKKWISEKGVKLTKQGLLHSNPITSEFFEHTIA